MKQPGGPTIPPSEPEVEERIIDAALDEIQSGNRPMKIHLTYVREILQEWGLDVDEEGFIIHTDTSEYSVPYVFDRELLRETVREEGETIFEAFFVPVTSERVHGKTHERLHLSDLHSVIRASDGKAHPVRSSYFEVEEMWQELGRGFSPVMAWSPVIRENAILEEADVKWISVGLESDEPLELSCFSPECGFSGVVEEWDGEETLPECPDCGGEWEEDISVCMACQEWHRGTHWSGDSIHSEPACPDCGAGVERLEKQSRYDEIPDFEL